MEWFGWLGTCLFIACYAPQIYRTKKRKSVGDVSTVMWFVQWSAYTSCLIYSLYIKALPLIFGYAMGWLMTAWWLELARQYKAKHEIVGACESSSHTYVIFRFPHRRRSNNDWKKL